MQKLLILITLLILSANSSNAQKNLNDYSGNWEGELPNAKSLNFDLMVEVQDKNSYELVISNYKTSIKRRLNSIDGKRFTTNVDDNIRFDFAFEKDRATLDGFISSGVLLYHVSLRKTDGNVYSGSWNPIMIDELKSQSVYLSFENYDDGNFAMYPFFGDQRFSGTWAGGFTRDNDIVTFRDYKTGLGFKATLLADKIQLEILLGARTMSAFNLQRSNIDLSALPAMATENQGVVAPANLNDGWEIATIKDNGVLMAQLEKMTQNINSKELVHTHSVLVARKGKLLFEGYYDGYNVNIPHDQRSASKSVSSAMIGIAIDDQLISSTDEKLYRLLPENYKLLVDGSKKNISVENLLTMSSGLDAIDFGIEGNSAASEDSYQNSDNWLKTVLEASMRYEPGEQANYGSANPYLLGMGLDQVLETPLEIYMDEQLFAPLGITNYIIQTDNSGKTPYFGGGMYLTPRDMLKFGQLYLDKGKWNGKQIISENFVAKSFKKYGILQNTNDKNEYGYLWWHKTYQIGGRSIESIEARGSGGQYIFVIPELESVIAITSGNFRNGKFQQPEEIVEKFILPALLD